LRIEILEEAERELDEAIAYLVWSETVWIVATAHSKKRPEYWIRRKSHIPDL
jgi:hypothetical protein